MNSNRKIKVSTITSDACVFFGQTLSWIKASDSENARNVLTQKGVLIGLRFTKVFYLFNIGHKLCLRLLERRLSFFRILLVKQSKSFQNLKKKVLIPGKHCGSEKGGNLLGL